MDTIDRVIAQFLQEKSKNKDLSAKSMLEDGAFKEVLCSTAKSFIEKEISTQQKQFDMEKVLEDMKGEQFIEFGR